jgi:hypothetical protein
MNMTCRDSYLKIDVAIFVHVECAKDMITKFLGIARWKEHFVHIDELGGCEFAVRAVLLKIVKSRVAPSMRVKGVKGTILAQL